MYMEQKRTDTLQTSSSGIRTSEISRLSVTKGNIKKVELHYIEHSS
jgi:hypothetical protein